MHIHSPFLHVAGPRHDFRKSTIEHVDRGSSYEAAAATRHLGAQRNVLATKDGFVPIIL